MRGNDFNRLGVAMHPANERSWRLAAHEPKTPKAPGQLNNAKPRLRLFECYFS